MITTLVSTIETIKLTKFNSKGDESEALFTQILAKVLSVDAGVVYRSSKFALPLLKLYNKAFGSERLAAVVPHECKKLLKSFHRKMDRYCTFLDLLDSQLFS